MDSEQGLSAANIEALYLVVSDVDGKPVVHGGFLLPRDAEFEQFCRREQNARIVITTLKTYAARSEARPVTDGVIADAREWVECGMPPGALAFSDTLKDSLKALIAASPVQGCPTHGFAPDPCCPTCPFPAPPAPTKETI